MGKYSLIAFDMDGTLLNSKKQLQSSTREAVKAAAAAGKTVVICTGRGMPEIYEYLPLEGLSYIISTSGTLVFDVKAGAIIHESALDPETVRGILDIARQDDIMVHMLLPDRVVAERRCVEKIDHYSMAPFRELFERVAYKPESIFDFYDENPVPAPKVNLYHPTTAMREKSRRLAREAGLRAEVTNSEIASLEFTPLGITKGTGIEYLCELLGISRGETISVGDGENDIPMFASTGLRLAMGNASQPAKDAADAVLHSCDEDGCAQAIYDYLLRE